VGQQGWKRGTSIKKAYTTMVSDRGDKNEVFVKHLSEENQKKQLKEGGSDRMLKRPRMGASSAENLVSALEGGKGNWSREHEQKERRIFFSVHDII